MYNFVWLIFAILFILYIVFRDRARKERNQELQEMYPEIKNKWIQKTEENFREAMKVYPSKQFFEKNEEK